MSLSKINSSLVKKSTFPRSWFFSSSTDGPKYFSHTSIKSNYWKNTPNLQPRTPTPYPFHFFLALEHCRSGPLALSNSLYKTRTKGNAHQALTSICDNLQNLEHGLVAFEVSFKGWFLIYHRDDEDDGRF